MRGSTLVATVAALVLGSGASVAADWSAMVVGQSQNASAAGPDDAILARQAFDVSGIPVVGTVLNGTVAAFRDAATGLAGSDGAVIFYSGPRPRDGSGGLGLGDGTVGLDALMATVAASGVSSLVLMIENCPRDGSGTGFSVILPPPPPGLDVMMVTSADDTTACTAEARLTGRLDWVARFGPARGDLRADLAGLPVQGFISDAIAVDARSTAIDGGDDIEFLPDDVILLDAVDGAQTDAPIEVVLPVLTPEDAAASREPLITLAVLPAEQIAALPLLAGQPEPSIIVGMIDGITDAALRSDAAQQDDGRALAYDDIDARRALRSANPALFDILLAAGSLDPPDSQLAVALQTELQRMNCYTLRVDGDWGNGSRRAFQAYLDRLDGVQVASLDASVDLFRLILRNDAVTCPAAAPAAAATTRSAAPARTAPAQPAPPAAAQPAPTTPAREPTGGGFPGNFGGVFR